ncbi:MAG: leucine-rich repeat protein [Coriobacteriia bacterium]|nr:leucine-rich repeat protein [Coriobacteriia bacterium]
MINPKNVIRTALSLTLACGLVPAGALSAFAAEPQAGAASATEAVAPTGAGVPDADGTLAPVADGASSDVDVAAKAQAAVDQPVQELLEDYFQDRSQTVMGQTDLDQDVVEDQVADAQQGRADGFAEMEESANIRITGVQTDVTVTSAKAVGDELQVQAYEQVVFTYDNLADGVGGSDTARFGTSHDLTLATDGPAPVIAQDSFDEQDLCGVSTDPTADQPAGGLSALNIGDVASPGDTGEESPAGVGDEGPASSPSPTAKYQATYCPADAVAYSNKYWSKYNKAYKNYNPVGGDCANFTSQSISAGGMKHVKGSTSDAKAWFYTDGELGSGVSTAWIYCPSFVTHFKEYGKYIENPKASQVFTGSPVLYRVGTLWNHAVLCVGRDSAGTPIINSHNSDRYHMPYTYYNNAKRCTIQLTRSNTGHNLYTTKSKDKKTTFTWMSTSTTTAQLHSVKSTAAEVVIPATVTRGGRAHKVTNIRRNAFKGNTTVTSVTIPKYVKYVGASAFSGCKNLAKVQGAKAVTHVYGYAFYNCQYLTELPALPKLKYLGTAALRNCYRLTSVPVPAKATYLSKDVYRGCVKLKTVELPATLTTVGEGAFRSCKRMTKLTLPAGVSGIGDQALRGCAALQELNLTTQKLTSSNVPGKYTFADTPSTLTVHAGAKASAYKKWLTKRGLSSKAKVVA